MSKHPELRALGVVAGGLLALLLVVFYREQIWRVLYFWAILLWLFVIPGYALFCWSTLRFPLKLAFGIGLQLALLVILSYWLSWVGLHVKFHGMVLPLLAIGLGLALHRAPRLRKCALLQNF